MWCRWRVQLAGLVWEGQGRAIAPPIPILRAERTSFAKGPISLFSMIQDDIIDF